MNSKHTSFIKVFLFVFLIDQSSKFIAQIYGLSVTHNTGVSLSFLSGSNPIFLTIILSFLIWFIYSSFNTVWKNNPLISGLFFGGAVANIIDRILFGGVRDWLIIPFTQIRNNLADWAIFIALGLLFFNLQKSEQKNID